MLNENMYAVAVAIGEVIVKNFPIEYQMYVFDGKLTHDIIGQVLWWNVVSTHMITRQRNILLNYHLNQRICF